MGKNDGNGDHHGASPSIADRVRGIAFAWEGLDAAVSSSRDNSEISVNAIKLINKGDRWLVMIFAECNGEYYVNFKEATSSGDIGKVVRSSLETPDWRPDKYRAIDKSKT